MCWKWRHSECSISMRNKITLNEAGLGATMKTELVCPKTRHRVVPGNRFKKEWINVIKLRATQFVRSGLGEKSQGYLPIERMHNPTMLLCSANHLWHMPERRHIHTLPWRAETSYGEIYHGWLLDWLTGRPVFAALQVAQEFMVRNEFALGTICACKSFILMGRQTCKWISGDFHEFRWKE